MASNRFTRTRAKIARRSKSLPADHPELVALREDLASALVVHRIGLILDKAPVLLTPELRAEIEDLLAEREVAAA